jgi:hypothetical protein
MSLQASQDVASEGAAARAPRGRCAAASFRVRLAYDLAAARPLVRGRALRALAGLARDLPRVSADEAWRRLARLTDEQRAQVIVALARLGPEDWPPASP